MPHNLTSCNHISQSSKYLTFICQTISQTSYSFHTSSYFYTHINIFLHEQISSIASLHSFFSSSHLFPAHLCWFLCNEVDEISSSSQAKDHKHINQESQCVQFAFLWACSVSSSLLTSFLFHISLKKKCWYWDNTAFLKVSVELERFNDTWSQ